jgi:hypothetical protein
LNPAHWPKAKEELLQLSNNDILNFPIICDLLKIIIFNKDFSSLINRRKMRITTILRCENNLKIEESKAFDI